MICLIGSRSIWSFQNMRNVDQNKVYRKKQQVAFELVISKMHTRRTSSEYEVSMCIETTAIYLKRRLSHSTSHAYTYTHTLSCTRPRTHQHTYTHTCKHTHTHTYIHTGICIACISCWFCCCCSVAACCCACWLSCCTRVFKAICSCDCICVVVSV